MKNLPSKSDFLHWRNPQRGSSNPERMDNPFWHWCVRTGESAYFANQNFDGPDSMDNGPCWCFQRMGQAHITLPDGRELYIAGEHEDHYDPDFYIYNDVVIVDGDHVEIFGYPESAFPPTDFHTATLVGKNVFLIGNLGYPSDRKIAETQVLRLDLESFEMSVQSTLGKNPGWIHNHSAIFDESSNSIRVTGGKRWAAQIAENFHDFELCLKTFSWRIAVERKWKSWILERVDDKSNNLSEIKWQSWHRKFGLPKMNHLSETFENLPDEVIAEMPRKVTEQQLIEFENLYRSPFDDSLAVEDEEQFGRYRLTIDGITVRFDEDMYGVTVTVEGELPQETTEAILAKMNERLASIEQTPYKTVQVEA